MAPKGQLHYKLRQMDAAVVNKTLRTWLPELASNFGQHPIQRPEPAFWLDSKIKTSKKHDLKENHKDHIPKADDGSPAFIPVEKNKNGNVNNNNETATTAKLDYVLGNGPRGYGYYHLLTQWSYHILYKRIKAMKPQGLAFFNKAIRRRRDEWELVYFIVSNRAISDSPNDAPVYYVDNLSPPGSTSSSFLLSGGAAAVAI